MKTLFPTIAKSWNAFMSQKKLVPLIVFIDVLFIYGMTRLHYEVFSRASMVMVKLTSMLGEQVQTIAESETVQELAVLRSPEFITAYQEMLKYLGIFFAGALVLWFVGKGFVWFLAHKTAEKKVDAKAFATKFLGMTLFWFVVFIALTLLALNLLDYALFGTFALIGKTGANALVLGLYWLLAYFVSISYALVPRRTFKPTFALGVKHWKELLPVHAVSSLVFFVAATAPVSLVKVNIYLSLAFAVFIALPAIAWTRVLWITAVQKVMKHGQD